MSIGKNIKKYRVEKGLTQKELAQKCGVAVGTIQQYELEKRHPRIEIASKIASALDINVMKLLAPSEDQLVESEKKNEVKFLTDDEAVAIKMLELFTQLNINGQEETLNYMSLLTEIKRLNSDNKNVNLEAYSRFLYDLLKYLHGHGEKPEYKVCNNDSSD